VEAHQTKSLKIEMRKTNSQKSFAVKEQMRIGSEISAQLPQLMTQGDVAKSLGISQQMVCRIERRALFKLRNLLLASARKQVVGQPSTVVISV
jgi:hypothetical protein